MKTPKTFEYYLKLLITIANDSVEGLDKTTLQERQFLGLIRADIQNNLGSSEFKPILEKYGLKYP